MKVEPGPSSPNPSTACMCALKWVLCVGHVSDDGQTDRWFRLSSQCRIFYKRQNKNFFSTCYSPVSFYCVSSQNSWLFTKPLPQTAIFQSWFRDCNYARQVCPASDLSPCWSSDGPYFFCNFIFSLSKIKKTHSVCLSAITYNANISIPNVSS